MSPPPMIEATELHKRYGDFVAVQDVSLSVPRGSILGVLGPNGAGKSTSVRMLTTMTRPDAGGARVAGIDVVAQPKAVRRLIGVTGQDATLDDLLTGRQNLTLIGRLAKLGRRSAQSRATELLSQFSLTDAADRPVKTYSGGMRRRLDLAASLVMRPPVLFLDEPTTGLDPTSRREMWSVIAGLVGDGTTVLLTTQYLDEADALADAIDVIDQGRVIAHGTAAQLKARIGGDQLILTLPHAQSDASGALAPFATAPIHTESDGLRLIVPVAPRTGLTTDVVRALDAAAITVDHLELRRPSLDDVFFALTGSAGATDAPTTSAPPRPSTDSSAHDRIDGSRRSGSRREEVSV